MNKADIKHIFFDLDNTLWNHRENSIITLREMFREHKIEEEFNVGFDDWHSVFYDMNELLWADLRDGKITKKDLRERRFKEPFVHFKIEDENLSNFFEEQYLKRMTGKNIVVDGAEELLKYLHPKYTLHIITNGFVEVSEHKVKNSVLNGFFKTLTCADEIGVRKPDPKLFDLALEKANAKKEESIFIGDDWIADIVGANHYGMQSIYFDSLKEGQTMNGVPVVTSLLDIREIL
ncbi:YjjG family noncanonical pyrimidine nucleotidase [Weeksellaceae bacterium TAE3-ERU29]|nr:YjjG family noncanonical pyrimidine nucleotidase [Weeksellaceae bacterium TAE3-ERU29]